jgi:exopolysaccharide production protein ExoQ
MRKPPVLLSFFVLLCGVSVMWSNYRLETLLGFIIQLLPFLVAVTIAATETWEKILSSLSSAGKWILGLSYAFELVAAFMQRPIEPFVGAVSGYHWVDGLLFSGGPIQGIPGNRNLIAFVALICIIVFTVELMTKRMGAFKYGAWLVVSVATLFLTESATVILACFALAILGGLIAFMRRVRPGLQRFAYYALGGLMLTALSVAVVYSATIFSFVGRESDLSGRTYIWGRVLDLIQMNPILGWGWVGYWPPWVEPYSNLAVINGTTYLQAHNAFFDILLQVGIIGGIIAAVIAVRGSVRAWRIAVTPVNLEGVKQPYRAITLLPVMLLAALLIQSLTESRLLIEGNWLLFVLICCKAYYDDPPRLITLKDHESETLEQPKTR